MTNFTFELDAAKKLAREAGRIVMSYWRSPLEVEWKGPKDPVTIADRKASRYLVDELHRLFPLDVVVSEEEEGGARQPEAKRVWFVDPLDGTKEFIAARGEFVVMLGLLTDGIPRVGVVFQPTIDKMYSSAQGSGAFIQQGGAEQRLQVSNLADPSLATMAVSRSRRSPAQDRVRNQLNITSEIACGSLGLKVGLICEGKAHIYVQGGQTGPWDVCAPEAILREAGGEVTDLSGGPLPYLHALRLKGVVASNGVLHDRVLGVSRAISA